jgi:sterol desaturase/sphingolipid hydroxylase (fatty acid hydroxylase superfamily)
MVVDALLCFGIPAWWRTRSIPISGLPLLALTLYAVDAIGLLPSTMEAHATPDPARLLALFVSMDALQTVVHILTHRGWFGDRVHRHHRLHHRHRNINSASAFDTGFLDALVQLIFPLIATLNLIQPDRTSAILFGVCYIR